MAKITDYNVVTHPALNGLIDKIQNLLKMNAGWEPLGGIYYKELGRNDSIGFYAQVMIKKEGTKK